LTIHSFPKTGEFSPVFFCTITISQVSGEGLMIWEKLKRYYDAWRVDNLISNLKWLRSDGYPTTVVDNKIAPYRRLYFQAGAKYGENDAGMVKWFYERAEE
jgi:hypothetical protein